MSLLKYVVVGAVGYYLGQPRGREQVQRLYKQAEQKLRSPEADRIKQRGKEITRERATAARDLMKRKAGSNGAVATDGSTTTAEPPSPTANAAVVDQTSPAPAGPDPETGFGGRTVAEDTEAVRTGVTPPPPLGRVTGDTPAADRP